MSKTIKLLCCSVAAIHLLSCNNNGPSPATNQDTKTNQITYKIDSLKLLQSDTSMLNTRLMANKWQTKRHDSIAKSFQLRITQSKVSKEDKVILKERLEIELKALDASLKERPMIEDELKTAVKKLEEYQAVHK